MKADILILKTTDEARTFLLEEVEENVRKDYDQLIAKLKEILRKKHRQKNGQNYQNYQKWAKMSICGSQNGPNGLIKNFLPSLQHFQQLFYDTGHNSHSKCLKQIYKSQFTKQI